MPANSFSGNVNNCHTATNSPIKRSALVLTMPDLRYARRLRGSTSGLGQRNSPPSTTNPNQISDNALRAKSSLAFSRQRAWNSLSILALSPSDNIPADRRSYMQSCQTPHQKAQFSFDSSMYFDRPRPGGSIGLPSRSTGCQNSGGSSGPV